jgi:dihydroorotate dehydrogenase
MRLLVQRLAKATSGCQTQNMEILRSALELEDALPSLDEVSNSQVCKINVSCPNLNIYACRISEQSNQFIVFVFKRAVQT